jgi:hypothetical protein
MFVVPDLVATFPNLRLHVGQGDIERGGIRVRQDSLPGRLWGQRIIPEFGQVQVLDGQIRYDGSPDLNFVLEGWEETLHRVGFVEIIARLDSLSAAASAAELRNAGRRAIASLRAQLDLVFGPRLLGALLLEEVGAVFDDWHWNRRLDAVQVAAESQAALSVLPASHFSSHFSQAVENHFAKDRQQQRRAALAARWYWLAEAEEDPANQFLQYWIVAECLEMKTTDIKPVSDRLAKLFSSVSLASWRNLVGRLFGMRGKLVHGNVLQVDGGQLVLMRLVARVLLAYRLTGTVPVDEGKLLSDTAAQR